MSAQLVPEDFTDFLKALNTAGVEFLIVGGYAVGLHGYVRDTGDIDVFVRASRENAGKTLAALTAFSGSALGLVLEDFLRGEIIQLGINPVRIDILTRELAGVPQERLWGQAVEGSLGGVPVKYISRECLILNKLAAGRPKDIRDAEVLKAAEESERTKNKDKGD